MNTLQSEEHLWISADGQVTSTEKSDNGSLTVHAEFDLESDERTAWVMEHPDEVQFTERSTLARIGIDLIECEELRLNKGKVHLVFKAFVIGPEFPTWDYLPEILKPGIPVGRLFSLPKKNRLSATEITDAISQNELKLPNTISIDHGGQVHIAPHRAEYSLPKRMPLLDLQRLARGNMPRSFLNKVQTMREVDAVRIPPKTGILTSCTMYLRRHYVLLKRGEGNFGVHSGAVLLDPAKTFGPNIMLEIYNLTDQLVLNPLVAVEIYRAPHEPDPQFEEIARMRQRRYHDISASFEAMDACAPEKPAKEENRLEDPRISITTSRQLNITDANPTMTLPLDGLGKAELAERIAEHACRYGSIVDALSHKYAADDTLVTTFFPNLFEHIELLARCRKHKIRHLVFRNASREQSFFLTAEDQSRLETYAQLGIQVHWYCEPMTDFYQLLYKKGHGFFIREELESRFEVSTIFAMYGSAFDLAEEQTQGIHRLTSRLVDFFGPSIGFLTGGGGGVMGTAADAARERGALVGSCFLELEAQPPKTGVDFFNSFREDSRHVRQKWFEVADFCIFNIGGLGTLEEIGIEMCNLKLGIRPRMPYVFYGTDYWLPLRSQVERMIEEHRTPAWIRDYVLFTDSADEVIDFYRRVLQVM